MEWIELIVKAIGLIAAIFSSYKVTVKYIEKNVYSRGFAPRFGVRRNVRGVGCMRFFQKPGALSSRNEVSNAVKQQLTREIAKDVVHAYSIERRSSRLSRDMRDSVSLIVSMLILSLLVTALVGVSKISDASPVMQPIISIAMFVLWSCIFVCNALVILQFYYVFTRILNEGLSLVAAQKSQLEQVSLESIPDGIEKGEEYIFVDGTIRSCYQVPFMRRTDGVQTLLDYGTVAEGELSFRKSEAKQIKADDYEEVADKLVDSFLSKASIRDSEPVCFVFSQTGITAVLVTQLLSRKGLRAFYIGATDGYEAEVRGTIREVRILRDSGLI